MPTIDSNLVTWMQLLANCATIIGILALWPVVRSLRNDRVRAWADAHGVFMEEHVHADKKIVFGHYNKGDHFDSWPEADREAGIRLCRVMEEVCYYRSLLGDRLFWSAFGHPVAKAFLMLEPAIFQERKHDHREKGKWPKWWRFEEVGRIALRKRAFLEVGKWVGWEGRGAGQAEQVANATAVGRTKTE